MKITGYIEKGNSFPVILEIEKHTYLVKLRAGMSSKHSLINEWIGNKIGSQLKIKTQEPHWIKLDKKVDVADVYIEVRELVNKSIGLNIGFVFHASANELSVHDLTNLPQATRNHIFLFDLMMINVDRTPQNLNLMKVEDEVFSIDYESSLLFQEILENKNLLEDERILQSLRNNPLYQEMDDALIDTFVKKIKSLSLDEMIADIPEKLLSEEERVLFLKEIERRNNHGWFLKEAMDKLKLIQIETAEDLKIRRNKNHEDFLSKFKANLK